MGILSSSIWVLYQGWFFLAAMERKNITNLFCFECSHYIVHTFFPWCTETLQRAWNVWKVNSQNITRLCGYYDSHLGYISGRWLLSPLYHASFSQVVLQVFRERLSEKIRTRQSQKVIGIWSIHCSWHCSCQTYVCCFFSALVNMSMASRVILSKFFDEQWIQSHPQYLSGLSRALFATAFLKIAVCNR